MVPLPRAVTWACVCSMLALLATLAVASALPRPPATGTTGTLAIHTTDARLTARADRLGLVVSVRASFARPVTLEDPLLRIGKDGSPGEMMPVDGRDHDGEDLEPLVLPAGTEVAISGFLQPRCTGRQDVSISVRVQGSDGGQVIRRYLGRNTAHLETALRRFCDRGVVVVASPHLWRPDGDAEVGLAVVNPGPDDVTVRVPAYSDDHVSWSAVGGTIPSGTTGKFEIHGTDVGCEPGESASWQRGRLRINGRPHVVASRDGWC